MRCLAWLPCSARCPVAEERPAWARLLAVQLAQLASAAAAVAAALELELVAALTYSRQQAVLVLHC